MRNDVCTRAAALALLILSTAAWPATLDAQGTISGRIVDGLTSQPLPSVQVFVVGVTGPGAGTLTNAAGQYTLTNVPAGAVSVRALRIGYAANEQAIEMRDGQAATVNFTLSMTQVELDAIVATVDAVALRRREMGTDIGRVDVAAAVNASSLTSMSELIQGRTAGVTVTRAGGNVGKGSRIRIRGSISITQPNNPLLIIDGVRADNNTSWGDGGTTRSMASRFDDLRPEDIEDIQIIKGPSATALYGSEAAVGVLVITTKKGQTGAPRFNFTMRHGYAEQPTGFPTNYSDVTEVHGVTDLNDPRIAYMQKEQHPLTGHIFITQNPLDDPETRPFTRGGGRSYAGADVSGGSQSFRYYSSFGYGYDTGLIEKEFMKTRSWRGSLEVFPVTGLTVSADVGLYGMERVYQPDQNHYFSFGTNAFLGNPTTALDSQGRCIYDILRSVPDTGAAGWCMKGGNLQATFTDILNDWNWQEEVVRATASFAANWAPREWFANRVVVGQDRTVRLDLQTTALNARRPFTSFSDGNVQRANYTNQVTTFDYSGTITRPLTDRLESTTTIGAQYFINSRELMSCVGSVYAAAGLTSCQSGAISTGSSSFEEQREVGAFILQRLGWADYFFVTGALRRDDNASLGSEVGAIWTPSGNVSIVVSEMPFWNVRHLDELRVRAAWGTASQSPRPYQAERFFGIVPVTVNGQLLSGVSPSNPGNPQLGPERSEEIELGFEGQLFGRLGFNMSYYNVVTRDLMVLAPVAPSTGFSQPALTNLGEMTNRGFEISLDGNLVQRPSFVLNATLTHSTQDPIITDLGLDAPIVLPSTSGSRSANSQGFVEGYAPGVYISPLITAATRDEQGNITNVEYAPGTLADGSNLVVVGKPNPDATQSLSTRATIFGNWTVTAFLERSYGSSLYNVSRAFQNPFTTTPGTSAYSHEYAYRQINSTPVQQAMMEQRLHAAFIESGDYTKLREISVRTNLPESFATRMGAAAMSMTASLRNVYTWTPFSWGDPEVESHGAADNFYRHNFGVTQPPPRTWTLELNVAF